jgi:nicotinamidase/pyrazinamidase
MSILPASVLLVIDVQNDFLPGGALAVPDGHAVIPPIHALAEQFEHVILTQDWHPAGHMSFASSRPGRQPFEVIPLPDGRAQVLWPDHCVQGTSGAALSSALRIPKAELILRKGFRSHIDSYSAFAEADGKTATGLTGYLRERGVKRVYLCGLALDFCVSWSALDAMHAGFETFVVPEATRAIDTNGSLEAAIGAMHKAGVHLADGLIA